MLHEKWKGSTSKTSMASGRVALLRSSLMWSENQKLTNTSQEKNSIPSSKVPIPPRIPGASCLHEPSSCTAILLRRLADVSSLVRCFRCSILTRHTHTPQTPTCQVAELQFLSEVPPSAWFDLCGKVTYAQANMSMPSSIGPFRTRAPGLSDFTKMKRRKQQSACQVTEYWF